MFRRVEDFERAWAQEREGTLKVLRVLSDASLGQAVTRHDRTLGRIAWHLATTLGEMLERTGLRVSGPAHESKLPEAAAAIVDAYERASRAVGEEVAARWKDADLELEDEMYGEKWARGLTLQALIVHQAHHRGQMTVLMRQAGLAVPGVYGPAREEWTAFGMPAPEI
jgi:uncharacterized damage-inducible protein DinB